MTKTITTAKELVEYNSDFLALLRCWERDRRCPLPMVDLLLEYELKSQAEAARWAATEKDKRQNDNGRVYGPSPCKFGGVYYWVTEYQVDKDDPYGAWPESCYTIPKDNFERVVHYGTNKFYQQVDALVWLLDNWRIA